MQISIAFDAMLMILYDDIPHKIRSTTSRDNEEVVKYFQRQIKRLNLLASGHSLTLFVLIAALKHLVGMVLIQHFPHSLLCSKVDDNRKKLQIGIARQIH